MDKTTKNLTKTDNCVFTGQAVGVPLGIHAKSADISEGKKPLEQILSESRLAAFHAQSAARGILPTGWRTKNCLRLKVDKSQLVGIKYAQTAKYHGLQTCGSVWACPVCARKISEHRRRELTAALANWRAQAGNVYLLTLTFPHQRQDSIEDLLTKFGVAQKGFKATRVWNDKFLQGFGVVGSIKALEVTHGSNGWHPHVHLLVFAESGQGSDGTDKAKCEAIKELLFPAWAKACLKAGLESPSREHGIDVRDGSWAEKYVGKWGLEQEMTKAHIKRGKAGGHTPFDLLRLLTEDSENPKAQRAPELFRAYAQAFKGKRQLVWTKGLRDLLGLSEPELSDEEAAAGADEGAQLLASLSDADWRMVVSKNQRGELLEAVNTSKGQASSVTSFLSKLRSESYPHVDIYQPRVFIRPVARKDF